MSIASELRVRRLAGVFGPSKHWAQFRLPREQVTRLGSLLKDVEVEQRVYREEIRRTPWGSTACVRDPIMDVYSHSVRRPLAHRVVSEEDGIVQIGPMRDESTHLWDKERFLPLPLAQVEEALGVRRLPLFVRAWARVERPSPPADGFHPHIEVIARILASALSVYGAEPGWEQPKIQDLSLSRRGIESDFGVWLAGGDLEYGILFRYQWGFDPFGKPVENRIWHGSEEISARLLVRPRSPEDRHSLASWKALDRGVRGFVERLSESPLRLRREKAQYEGAEPYLVLSTPPVAREAIDAVLEGLKIIPEGRYVG